MWLIDKSAGEAIQFTPVFVDGPAGMATYEEAKHFADLATRAVLEAVEHSVRWTGRYAPPAKVLIHSMRLSV